VHIIAPFTAGGGTDVLARIVAKELSLAFKQSFVVDNRTGATGSIGADYVAKSAPDGYTLLLGSNGPNAINALMNPKLSYDPRKDFAPVSEIALVPNVLLVSPSLPVANVKELIALAKSRPGKLTFGSAGVGSPAHLAGELFKSMADVDMVHVPYKGGAAVMTDLRTGRIDMMFADQVTAVPQVKAKALRALAVTTAKRSMALPQLPTIAEAALPGYDTGLWYGLFAPAGTPEAVINKLNAELSRILTSEGMRKQIEQQGGEVVAGPPDTLKRTVDQEMGKWAGVIKRYHIRPD
jgi:tripartite-type tricarboxylate transporter receptor subunit TctC